MIARLLPSSIGICRRFSSNLLRDSRSRLLPVSRSFGTKLLPVRIPFSGSLRKISTKLPPTKQSNKYENIYTIPNGLTVIRILMSPFVGYFIATSQFKLGLGLMIIAGITDGLDGYIARYLGERSDYRNFKGQQSAIGSVLDPAADKILMAVLVGSLTYVGGLPLPLACLILGRDILLGLRTSYYRYITLPEPKTLFRYWNFSLVSAEIKVPFISKLNTVLQLALMGMTIVAMEYGFLMHLGMNALQELTAITTVWSGLYYFMDNSTTINKLS